MPRTLILIMFAALVFGANALRALTGLGSAVIFVPFATIVWSTKVALSISAILDLVGNAYLCWLNRTTIRIGTTYSLIVPMVVGVAVGSLSLNLHDRLIKVATGTLIVLTVVTLLFVPKTNLPILSSGWQSGFGLGVGLLSPISGAAGPTVAIMLTLSGKGDQIPVLAPMLLLILAVARVTGLLVLNQINIDVLKAAATLVPFGTLGVYIGYRFRRGKELSNVRTITLAIVALSGLWMIVRN